MVDGSVDVGELAEICAAHARLGATGILPTLITDTPEATATVISAGVAASAAGVPGFLGLHLEGPHLDPRRKGAHDPALIRPMDEGDLERLCDAARPTASPDGHSGARGSDRASRLRGLREAGAIVSLGHTDCSMETAMRCHHGRGALRDASFQRDEPARQPRAGACRCGAGWYGCCGTDCRRHSCGRGDDARALWPPDRGDCSWCRMRWRLQARI